MLRSERLRITTLEGMVAFLAALVAVLILQNNPASAQSTTAVPDTTITVNTKEDKSNTKGDCSLREAITAANTNAVVDGCAAGSATALDTIRFSLGQEATIVLVKTLPTVTDPAALTLNGGQKAKITISGNDKVRVLSVSKAGKLALKNLTVADGYTYGNGGGILNSGGTLTVTRSTFSGSLGAFGGGIANLNGGTLNAINSTFSGNKAGWGGGGIANDGKLQISYSTISGNGAEEAGGGISNTNDEASTVRLSNTILANNVNKNIRNACVRGQCQGKIIDNGYNISDDASYRFPDPTSKINTNPRLSASGLQDNGGPTKTIALQERSPAVNVIPRATNGCGTTIKTDQRGVSRPQAKKCDTGSFELKSGGAGSSHKGGKKARKDKRHGGIHAHARRGHAHAHVGARHHARSGGNQGLARF